MNSVFLVWNDSILCALCRTKDEAERYALLRNGAVYYAEVHPGTAYWVRPEDEPRTVLVRSSRLGKGTRPDYLKVQMWAPSAERAIEIARQWLGRYIDQGRWKERSGNKVV